MNKKPPDPTQARTTPPAPGQATAQTTTEDSALKVSRAEVITEGFKGLLIVNGGGAAALLAFVQATWSVAPELARLALIGIGIMAFGLAFALLVPMFRYFHGNATKPEKGQDGRAQRIGEGEAASGRAHQRTVYWWIYWACMFLSIAAFCGAMGVLVWFGLGLLPSSARADRQIQAVKNAVQAHWLAQNQGDFGASQHTRNFSVFIADVEGRFDATSRGFEQLWNRKLEGQLRDLEVQLLGDTAAVATFHLDGLSTTSAADRRRRRVTEVWVSEGGVWKEVHHHDSLSTPR